jgi:CBS domain-containing protein
MPGKRSVTIATRILDAKAGWNKWLKQQGLTEQEFIRLPNFEYVRNEVDFLNFEVQKVASESTKQFREAEAERVEKFILFLSSMDSVEKKMKKFDDLLVAHMEDLVLPILEQMVENDFSYLPIINEENECIEVFSAYVLMTYNSLGKALDKRTTFADIYDALQDDNVLRKNYVFKKLESPIHEVLSEFKRTSTFHQDVVLITRYGIQHEPLLGMITAWDI